MANTKVKKDIYGTYVRVGGWIGRPPTNSVFKEGDEIRGTHPTGSFVYVRSGKKGTPEYIFEMWNVEDVYEWHYIEGRGHYSIKLRNWNKREGSEDLWNRRMAKLFYDAEKAGLSLEPYEDKSDD